MLIVDLHLKGNLVIVVGSGNEGMKKVSSLLTQDCEILVISSNSNPQITKYVKQGKIKFKKIKLNSASFLSKYKPYLVMATTTDRALNRKIVEKARKMKTYAYASDDPEISDFSHPSVINIGDVVQIAISTGGKSPLMGKTLREKVEPIIKNSISELNLNQIKLLRIVFGTSVSVQDLVAYTLGVLTIYFIDLKLLNNEVVKKTMKKCER